MQWVNDFYTHQYKWLDSPAIWSQYTLNNLPIQSKRRAAAIERLAGTGPKRILELGCGSGLVACAMAQAGHKVVAVDIVDDAVANANRVASQITQGEMIVHQEDFFELELDDKFDVVCYFDGFGIGSDEDQNRLLQRIGDWLKPKGCALIDIYSPWLFANESGEMYQEGHMMGQVTFNFDECRLLDKMWPAGTDESDAITQSLRCYSLADFRMLLKGSNLNLETFEAYESAFDFNKRAPLKEAEIYLTKLTRTT